MENLKTIDECLDWIYGLGGSQGKHSLKKIEKLMAEFDNPQDKIDVIHVAGTNGKGSTCNFLANTLSKVARVGLFISPYMESITESMQINGVNITKERFIEYINEFKPKVEKVIAEGFHVTYFEVLTGIMYKYFSDEKVDVAVVEVGMGGELDSTNIIKAPIASVIVTISMDHVGVLGNTIEEIALNKAGIMKPGCPVFLYPNEKHIMDVLEDHAREVGSPFYTFDKSEVEIIKMEESFNNFNFREYKDIKTDLVGIHQLYNASLAIMVLDYFKDKFNLTSKIIKDSIYHTKNTGRLQVISNNPRVLVDGSHNKEAIEVLTESLKVFNYDNLILGFSILKDKDYKYAIKELSKLADKMVITTVDNPERAFTLDELKAEVLKVRDDVEAIEDRYEAYERTKELAGENDLILWCGSLYLVRDIINYEKKSK